MAEEVIINVDQNTQEVNIDVTSGGGLGTVTYVAISGTDGIEVDSGSPIITSGTIVLGLSSTVLSQLSLAASSVQPGDNITDLTNNAGYITGVGWGDIGGSLSSQTDLQSALDGKISSIQAGANVSIDNTDPQNPVISATGMGTGTVTSVGLSAPSSLFSVAGSPVTSSGTLDLDLISQGANQVFAGPDSGSPDIPTFRSLVVDDIPDLSSLYATTASLLDYLEIDQNLADLADASAARINLGLVIGTNVQAYDAGLQSISGLTTAANNGIYTTGSDTYATYSLTAGGRALGGVAGTANTIPYFSASNTVSLLTTTTGGRALLNNAGTANTFPYYSASNTVSLTSITAFGRSLIDDADAAAARTTLGAIGGTVGLLDDYLVASNGAGGATVQQAPSTVYLDGGFRIGNLGDISTVAYGVNALDSRTSGVNNVAIGGNALMSLTTGYDNVAIGYGAGENLVVGAFMVAIGARAARNTIESFNIAIGAAALENLTTGYVNTAIGYGAGSLDVGGGSANPIQGLYMGFDARAGGAATTNEIVISTVDGFGLGNNTTVIGNTSMVTTRLHGDVEARKAGGALLRAYGTFTSNTNNESVEIGHDGSKGFIRTAAGSGGGTVEPLEIQGSVIKMPGLPTSSAGLASGTLWNNSGVVNVVP